MSSWRSRNRGHFQRKHIEAVEEVLAERAIGDRPDQITIRRGNYANVDPDRLLPPDSLEFTFLKNSQQRHLSIGGEFSHLVRKIRSPSATSNRPSRRWRAPVNAPFS